MDAAKESKPIDKALVTSSSEYGQANQGGKGPGKPTKKDVEKPARNSKKRPQVPQKGATTSAPSKSKPGPSKSPAATSAQETTKSSKTDPKRAKPAKRNAEEQSNPKHPIRQTTALQLPRVDVSNVNVGSGGQQQNTGAVSSSTAVDKAKADGVLPLGNSVVSIGSTPGLIENLAAAKLRSRILSIGKGPTKGRTLDVFGGGPQIGKGKERDTNATPSKGKGAEVSDQSKNLNEIVSKKKIQTTTSTVANMTLDRSPADIDNAIALVMARIKGGEKNKKSERKTRDTNKQKPVEGGQAKAQKNIGSQRFRPHKPEDLKPRAAELIRPPPLTLSKEPIPIDVNMLSNLEKLVHPVARLQAYGYTTSSPTAEEIQTALAKVGGNQKCRRCEKTFVYKEIAWNRISQDVCVHHPGKCSTEVLGKKLNSGKPMRVWSCCFRRGFAPGCTKAPTHVLEMEDAGTLAALCPFEATPPLSDTTDKVSKCQKVIAIDCEMSFTKYGLTLSRMSVLSFPDCRVLEDTYIREPYPGIHFIDYNTRYSGVTHENLYPKDPDNSPPVLQGIIAARSKLWEYCDENTIIIGHGLDHDLKCLRMLHPKIIDTAVLFSKVEGRKSRLKTLAEDHLKWCIQEDVGNSTGHDSVEDCRACIELVLKFLQSPVIPADSAASEVPD